MPTNIDHTITIDFRSSCEPDIAAVKDGPSKKDVQQMNYVMEVQ